MSVYLVSFLVLSPSVTKGQTREGTLFISGVVTDQSTGEVLPFATVSLKGTSIGTIANADGQFGFQAPNRPDGVLICSFIGYAVYEIAVGEIGSDPLTIALEPSFIELTELIVRPISAEELLRRAIRKIPENYATTAFESKAYYREKIAENTQPIAYAEGYFKSYYPDYQTDSSQHQLLLYRNADQLYGIDFMLKKRLKKEAKKQKKAEKKGEEYEPEFDEGMVQSALGGPEGVIEGDPVLSLEHFLDTTLFKKFRYEYAGATKYLGREMVVVSFESKGTVEFVKSSGTIYLDHESDAIAAIEGKGKFVVPAWARPILFAAGFAVRKPFFEQSVRYQFLNGKWYPKYFYALGNVGLTKRYLFASNDKSDFLYEQVFTMNEILTEGASPIPKEFQFDTEEEMEEQVHADAAYDWSSISTLPPEKLEPAPSQ
ncbi:MAG: carboxypeptidase-like regulatory domain-containing protein [Bacteroidota bacterium]